MGWVSGDGEGAAAAAPLQGYRLEHGDYARIEPDDAGVLRCEQLGITLLNFHPGAHLKKITEDECLDLIAESVNITLEVGAVSETITVTGELPLVDVLKTDTSTNVQMRPW